MEHNKGLFDSNWGKENKFIKEIKRKGNKKYMIL